MRRGILGGENRLGEQRLDLEAGERNVVIQIQWSGKTVMTDCKKGSNMVLRSSGTDCVKGVTKIEGR